MRLTKVLIAISLLSSATAFARHDRDKGPCSSYMTTCKEDPSVTGATDKDAKWKAMKACVTKAATADSDNGKKCLDAQAKHEEKKDQ